MISVTDIYKFIDSFAPFENAMDFDNVGILVGDPQKSVKRIMVALDVTKDVIMEASEENIDLIISHHPVIFSPIKSISSTDIPYLLANKDISVICAHTNFDVAKFGVNYWLCDCLGLVDISNMGECGMVGYTNTPLSVKDFALFVKEKLNARGVRYLNIKRQINKVAVVSGSGGDFIDDAYKVSADVLVTGEIKHHQLLRAQDISLSVIDTGHFKSEDIAMIPLMNMLRKKFPEIKFFKSKRCDDNIFYV